MCMNDIDNDNIEQSFEDEKQEIEDEDEIKDNTESVTLVTEMELEQEGQESSNNLDDELKKINMYLTEKEKCFFRNNTNKNEWNKYRAQLISASSLKISYEKMDKYIRPEYDYEQREVIIFAIFADINETVINSLTPDISYKNMIKTISQEMSSEATAVDIETPITVMTDMLTNITNKFNSFMNEINEKVLSQSPQTTASSTEDTSELKKQIEELKNELQNKNNEINNIKKKQEENNKILELQRQIDEMNNQKMQQAIIEQKSQQLFLEFKEKYLKEQEERNSAVNKMLAQELKKYQQAGYLPINNEHEEKRGFFKKKK